ncbi:kinase-like protein [Sarocladium strictum]
MRTRLGLCSMGSDDALPELVRDTELPTSFHHNNALTIHYKRWDRRKRELWHRNQSSIGRGGYGHVWLEQEIDNQGNRKESKSRQNMKDYVRELEAIAKFSQDKYSDYFVRSHGWYQSPDSLYIAMEYCPCGDLKNHVALHGAVGERHAQIIISQILRGLAHMHEEKFAHRDLKPANVLIVSRPPNEWIVKLCDFGLTKRAIQSESTTVKGTFAYLAPELLDENARKTDHFAGDVWCVGETAYELITAITVFPFLSTRVKYTHDQSVFPSEELRKAGAGEEALDFVMATMAPSPPDRPTAINALKHAWIPDSDDPEASPQLPNILVDWPQIPPPHDAVAGTDQWTTAIVPSIGQPKVREETRIIPTPPTETTVRVESSQKKASKTSSDDTAANTASQKWTGSPNDPMNETIALVADLAVRDALDITATKTGEPRVAAPGPKPSGFPELTTAFDLGHCAVAEFTYEKSEDNEVDLFEGYHVTHIEFVDEDWWLGRNHKGETGLFPSNHVQPSPFWTTRAGRQHSSLAL